MKFNFYTAQVKNFLADVCPDCPSVTVRLSVCDELIEA